MDIGETACRTLQAWISLGRGPTPQELEQQLARAGAPANV